MASVARLVFSAITFKLPFESKPSGLGILVFKSLSNCVNVASVASVLTFASILLRFAKSALQSLPVSAVPDISVIFLGKVVCNVESFASPTSSFSILCLNQLLVES